MKVFLILLIVFFYHNTYAKDHYLVINFLDNDIGKIKITPIILANNFSCIVKKNKKLYGLSITHNRGSFSTARIEIFSQSNKREMQVEQMFNNIEHLSIFIKESGEGHFLSFLYENYSFVRDELSLIPEIVISPKDAPTQINKTISCKLI